MSAPHIAAERATWLLQVISDPAVKLVPLRVAVAISHHLNNETRDAWPSQDRLAAFVGAHRGNVAHAIAALVSLGHLQVDKDGRGNRYRLAMRVPGNAHFQSTCFPGNAQSNDATRVAGNVQSASRETRAPRSPTRTNIEEQGLNSDGRAQGARPNSESVAVSVERHSPRDQSAAPDGVPLPGRLIADIFDAFGRELHDHETGRFHKLIEHIGRSELHARLEAYRIGLEAGVIMPVSMALWLRRQGLLEVRHAA